MSELMYLLVFSVIQDSLSCATDTKEVLLKIALGVCVFSRVAECQM